MLPASKQQAPRQQPRVVIVEDDPADLDLLRSIVETEADVTVVRDATKAEGVILSGRRPDLVILDIRMPGIDGYELCRSLKSGPLTADIPVIFITALQDIEHELKGLNLGAVDFISKPLSPAVVRIRIQHQLELHDRQRALRQRLDRARHDLRASEMRLIECLGRAAQFKDDSTGDHVRRMRHYVRVLARRCGLSPGECERLGWASTMHDIGMIGVPDEIVEKNGPLHADEEDRMRQHIEIGQKLIEGIGQGVLMLAEEIIQSHHERWDGSGYPQGLRGSDIPISGRIVAIADVFDSLTAPRAWRPAWSTDRAFDFIAEHGGSQFDPEIVAHFLAVRSEILAIIARYPAASS